MLAHARKRAPFQAQYSIKGDLIAYFCGKNDNWQQLWSRRLKGYAILGQHVAVLFRKPTSLYPMMLIMHEGDEAMKAVLQGLDLPHRKLEAIERAGAMGKPEVDRD